MNGKAAKLCRKFVYGKDGVTSVKGRTYTAHGSTIVADEKRGRYQQVKKMLVSMKEEYRNSNIYRTFQRSRNELRIQ